MPTRPSITQLLLAALLCTSFCGLSTGRAGTGSLISVVPQVSGGSNHAEYRPVAALDQEQASGLENTNRNEFPSVHYGIENVFSVLPPTSAVMTEIEHAHLIENQERIDFRRNKDPPG